MLFRSEILRKRREWLQAEIERTDLALSAALATKEPLKKQERSKVLPSTIQWAPKIDEVFENYDGELDYKRLSKKLVELGLIEAGDERNKGSILACLSRKVKQKQPKIERVRPGVYRRKQYRRRLTPTEEGTSNNDAPSF